MTVSPFRFQCFLHRSSQSSLVDFAVEVHLVVKVLESVTSSELSRQLVSFTEIGRMKNMLNI